MGAPPDPPRDGVVERLRVRARNAMGRGEVVDAIAAAIASIAPSRTTSVLVRSPGRMTGIGTQARNRAIEPMLACSSRIVSAGFQGGAKSSTA